jgi:hypothetical protein
LCSCPLLNSSLVIQKRARYYWAMPTWRPPNWASLVVMRGRLWI